jgi:hypothetical protein
MLMVFFSGESLLGLEALPKWMKFNQDYFLQSVLPALTNENDDIAERTEPQTFLSTQTTPHLTTTRSRTSSSGA